jgi:hypothetical protein
MIPKASNQANTKKELNTATKLATLLAPIDIDMNMVGFYLSTLPANSQLRLIDLLMSYVSMAKDSEHESIKAWANSY